MQKLSEIEPLAALFIQDQLRGSPLLLYSQVLDVVSRDANRLAGVQHKLLGRDIGAGFNALNPGLARGILRAAPDMRHAEAFRPDGIYVLPETVADLPPLAGILTAGAGNPLSHVQLLARNLGIPNVAVDESLLPALRRNDGRRIVFAVSPAGLVEINEDGPRWDAVFGDEKQPGQDLVFEPDLGKLDLSKRDFVSLDSAAREGLGPDRRSEGGEARRAEVALPRPRRARGRDSVRALSRDRARPACTELRQDGLRMDGRELPRARGDAGGLCGSSSVRGRTARGDLLDHRRHRPGSEFRAALRAAMDREFGPDFRGGVFVRSDTNVEDLPGFTGAGLNLTLFNVVGFENIVKAISEVWASPYAPRAWAWRQSHMKGPEHVYPAVLLLRTVPSDISGVMITQDVDTGDPNVLSVAVNEGVGGAVEGQAAESVRIDRRRGDAPPGNGHGCAPHGPAGDGRHREAAGLGSRDPARARRGRAADRLRRRNPQAVPAARRGRQARRGGRGVRFRGRQALAAADRPFNESRAARGGELTSSRWTRRWKPISAGRVDMREAIR